MKLSDEQQEVADHILSGKSCILLGQAGSGKSTLLQHVVPKLKGCVVCASTAAAATNVGLGATTAHSLFGLKPNLYTPEDCYKKVPKKLEPLLKRIKVLIIDEISLLRIDVLEKIDYMLRQVNENDKPFGGVTTVLVGDPSQLPSIVAANERSIFFRYFKSPWFFTSDSIKNMKVFTLNSIFRQQDPRQQRILQSIRNKDKFYQKAVDVLNTEAMTYNKDEPCVTICAYNKDVDRINQYWYNKNTNEEQQYVAICDAKPTHEKYFPVPKVVSLKVGVKVKVCANAIDGSYYNGMVGTVESMQEDAVIVKTDNGVNVMVLPFDFEVVEYKTRGAGITRKVVAKRTQIPLKMCYAISVHAAQGISVDRLNINLGYKTFAPNLTYVALSRARDLTKISFVRPLRYADVIVDTEALEFYQSILPDSQK